MAVQIPRVERFAPTNTPSVGRVDAQLPDTSKAFAMQSDAIMDVSKDMINSYEKSRKAANDTKTDELVNRFNVETNNMLTGPNGARSQKGDPVPVYGKLDENVDELYKRLVDDNQNLDNDAKALLVNKLGNARASFNIKKDTSYGSQYENYETNVTNDSVSLLKNELTEATGYINPKEPDSLIPFNNILNQIKSKRVESGIRTGRIQVDEKTGKPILDVGTGLQISKDLSDGIYEAIASLNAQNNPEAAEKVREMYKQYIDPVNMKKAFEGTEKAMIEKKSEDLYLRAIQMGPEKAIATIQKEKDPEVQAKAMQFLDDQQRREENIRQRSSTKNYNQAVKLVQERMNGTNPFVSVAEMERDPKVKMLLPGVTTAEQRKALYAMINAPKKSNEGVKSDAYDKYFKGDFKGMPYEDLLQIKADLSKEDASYFERKWVDANSTETKETSGKARAKANFMQDMIKRRMNELGIVELNRYGKYDGDQIQTMNQYIGQFMQEFDTIPDESMSSVSEQQKWVNDFVAKKMNTKPKSGFFGNIINTWRGKNTTIDTDSSAPNAVSSNPNPPRTATPPAGRQVRPVPTNIPSAPQGGGTVLTPAQKLEWAKRYKNEFNKFASPAELTEYIQRNAGK